MRKQQNMGVNRLEYIEEAMKLCGTYNMNSIDEIIITINQLHNSSSKQEELLSSKLACWYKGSVLERRIF